jgi:hypothetical protein
MSLAIFHFVPPQNQDPSRIYSPPSNLIPHRWAKPEEPSSSEWSTVPTPTRSRPRGNINSLLHRPEAAKITDKFTIPGPIFTSFANRQRQCERHSPSPPPTFSRIRSKKSLFTPSAPQEAPAEAVQHPVPVFKIHTFKGTQYNGQGSIRAPAPLKTSSYTEANNRYPEVQHPQPSCISFRSTDNLTNPYACSVANGNQDANFGQNQSIYDEQRDWTSAWKIPNNANGGGSDRLNRFKMSNDEARTSNRRKLGAGMAFD